MTWKLKLYTLAIHLGRALLVAAGVAAVELAWPWARHVYTLGYYDVAPTAVGWADAAWWAFVGAFAVQQFYYWWVFYPVEEVE